MNRFKKILTRSVLIILAAFCLIFFKGQNVSISAYTEDEWGFYAATSFASGDGTKANPYQISNSEELAYLSKTVNEGETYTGEYLILTQPLDLSGVDKVVTGLNWSPIGTEDYNFQGNFDGNNQIISNLSINKVAPFLGLFGIVNGSTIKNVNLTDVYLNNGDYNSYAAVGALAGYASGYSVNNNFYNCVVTGVTIVATGNDIGGMFGDFTDSNIYGCHVYNANITVEGYGVGGLYGVAYYNTDTNTYQVTDSSVSGSIYASEGKVAGIGGWQYNGNLEIINSVSSANVSSGETATDASGGLIGHLSTTDGALSLAIKNSYNFGSVSGVVAAGLVGYSDIITDSFKILNSVSAGQVTGVTTNSLVNLSSSENSVEFTNNYTSLVTDPTFEVSSFPNIQSITGFESLDYVVVSDQVKTLGKDSITEDVQIAFVDATNTIVLLDGIEQTIVDNGVLIDISSVAAGSHSLLIINSEAEKRDAVIKFDFRKLNALVEVLSNDVNMGTVVVNPEITGPVALGTVLELQAIANEAEGCMFLAWKDEKGTVLSRDLNYQYTVANDTVITANFADTNDVFNGFAYTNDATYPWVYGEKFGRIAILSSTQGIDTSETSISVTVQEAGVYSFDWFVSSESVSWDWLNYSINGTEKAKIGGIDMTDWETIKLQLNAGDIISWKYRKDSSSANGDDTGYITNFKRLEGNVSVSVLSNDISKGTISSSVELGLVPYGTEITLTASAFEGYIFSGWYDSSGIVSRENPYSFIVLGDTLYNAYFANYQPFFGDDNYDINYDYPFDLGEYDGKQVILSSNQGLPSTTSQISYIASVTGAYSFEWFVSSESVSYDWLSYSINGTEIAKIGGTSMTDWETKILGLYAGDILTWNYRKDGSGNSGKDTGYIANFKVAEGTANITPTLKTEGSGTITANTEFTNVPLGTVVTLSPVPAEGFAFFAWLDSQGNILSDNENYTFIVVGDFSIVAELRALYEVTNASELQEMNNDKFGIYSLTNDIDMIGFSWTSIGTSADPFVGRLNGNGYTIFNLSAAGGLFAYTNSATIENIVLDNFVINGSSTIGILGNVSNNDTVYQITINNSSISGTTVVGGLFGSAGNTVVDTLIMNDINVLGTGATVAGVFAKNTAAVTLKNAIISGEVVGRSNSVGGILGTQSGTLTIYDTTSYANVFGANHLVGGISGAYNGTTYLYNTFMHGNVSFGGHHNNNYPYWGTINGYGARNAFEYENSGQEISVDFRTSIGVSAIDIFNVETEHNGMSIPVPTPVNGVYSFDAQLLLKNTTASLGLLSETSPNGVTGNYGGFTIRFTMEDGTFKYISTLDRVNATFISNFTGENQINLDNLTSYVNNFNTMTIDTTIGTGAYKTSTYEEQNVSIWGTVLVDNANDYEHLTWIINGGIPTTFSGDFYYNCRTVVTLSIKLTNDIDLTADRYAISEDGVARLVSLTEYDEYLGEGKKFVLNREQGLADEIKLYQYYGLGSSEMYPYRGSIYGDYHSLTVNMNFPNAYLLGIINLSSDMSYQTVVSNLSVYGTIVGKYRVGIVGMFDGYSRSGKILFDNVINYADISGTGTSATAVGSMLGRIHKTTATFNNCINYGYISSSGPNSGIFVGMTGTSSSHGGLYAFSGVNINYGSGSFGTKPYGSIWDATKATGLDTVYDGYTIDFGSAITDVDLNIDYTLADVAGVYETTLNPMLTSGIYRFELPNGAIITSIKYRNEYNLDFVEIELPTSNHFAINLIKSITLHEETLVLEEKIIDASVEYMDGTIVNVQYIIDVDLTRPTLAFRNLLCTTSDYADQNISFNRITNVVSEYVDAFGEIQNSISNQDYLDSYNFALTKYNAIIDSLVGDVDSQNYLANYLNQEGATKSALDNYADMITASVDLSNIIDVIYGDEVVSSYDITLKSISGLDLITTSVEFTSLLDLENRKVTFTPVSTEITSPIMFPFAFEEANGINSEENPNGTVKTVDLVSRTLTFLMSNQNLTYNGLEQFMNYKLDGDLETDNITLNLLYNGNASVISAGNYLVTVSGISGNNTHLYNLQISDDYSRTLQIRPKEVIITVHDQTSVYGSPLVELDATIEGLVEGDELDPKLEKEEGLTVRSYEITSNASDLNYQITVIKGIYTITKKTITVMPDANQSKVYGEIDPEITYQVEGLVEEDQLTGNLTRVSGEDVGTYAISLGSLANPNYSIIFTDEEFTITVKAVDVIWVHDDNYTYTGSDQKASVEAYYLNISDEKVVLDIAFDNEFINAGEYLLTASFKDATNNYELVNPSLTLEIGKASRLAPVIEVVNNTQTSLTVKAIENGLYRINGGDWQIGSEFSGLNAETAYTIEVKVSETENYLESEFGFLVVTTIAKINQTLLLNNINKIYGDSVFELPLETEEGLLLVYQSSDDAIASINGNLVTIHKAGIVQITAEQAGTEIYSAFERTVDLVITKKAVTITVHDQTSVYGSPLVELDATIEGLVEGDELDPKLEKEEGLTVRSYEITSNASDLNYQITVIKGTYTITKKTITVMPDANQSKVYGEIDPEITYQVEGLVEEDQLTGNLTRVSGEDVGTYAISLGSLANPNYSIIFTDEEFTITVKAVDVIWVHDDNYTYTGSDQKASVEAYYLNISDEKVVLDIAFDNEFINAGEYLLTASFKDATNNYELVNPSLTLEIGKASRLAPVIEVVNNTQTSLTVKAIENGLYRINGGDWQIGSEFSGLNAETAYTIEVKVSETENYLESEFGFLVVTTIAKINQTLLLNNINKIYGDSVFELPLETEEGLLLVYQSSDDAIASINGNLVTIHKAGIVQITAEQAGTEIYSAFERTVDLVITKKAVTITVHDQTSVYGSPLVELDATIEGLVEGDELDPKLEKEEGLTVRSYEITSNASDLNYQITVIKGTYTITKKTITVMPDANQSKVYGEIDPEITYQVEGLGEEDQLTGNLTRVSGEDVGTYAISLGSLANPNYSIILTDEEFTITVKAVDVIWVYDDNYTYTGSDQKASVEAYYLNISDEKVVLDITFDNEFINAGEYLLTASFKEATNNYELVNPSLTVEIGKASRLAPNLNITTTQTTITIQSIPNALYKLDDNEWTMDNIFTDLIASSVHTVYIKILEDENYFESAIGSKSVILEDKINQTLLLNNINKIYGDSVFELPLETEEGLLLVYQSSDDAIASINGNLVTIHKAGTVQITAEQAGTEIYSAFERTVDLVITKKAVTITVHDQTSVYGSSLVELDATIEGLVEGDELDPKLEKEEGLTVRSYEITSNASDLNYQITVIKGIYTITKKTITVMPDANQSKVYGEIDPEITYQVEGLVEEDQLTGNLTRVSGEDVGTYAISLGSLANPNYSIIFTDEEFTITVKAVDVIWVHDDNYTYTGSDQKASVEAYYLNISDEKVVLDIAFDNEFINAGEYLLTASFKDATNNYELVNPSLTLEIGKASRLAPVIEVVNNTQTSLTVKAIENGLYRINGGDWQIGSEFSGLNAETAYTIEVKVSETENYLESEFGFLVVTTIAKINQTLLLNNINKIYGDSVFELPLETEEGLLLVYQSSDDAIASINGNLVTIHKAGIVQITAEQAGTEIYSAFERTVDLVITKKAVTITVHDQTSVYGSPLVELDATIEGLVEGDELDPKLEKEEGLTVRSYEITSNASDLNYQITVIKGTYTITKKTITVMPDANQSKVYGEIDPEITYQVEGLVEEDQLTGNLTRVSGEDVGTYAISLGSLANPNYSIILTDEEFTITVKAVDVIWVYDDNYTYTGSDQKASVEAYYLNISDEKVVLDITFDNEFINAGEYLLTASFKEATNNYELVNPSLTVEIGKASRLAPNLNITTTQTTITIQSIPNALYKLDDNEWTMDNIFTDLIASSVHTVYIKILEDENYFESAIGSKSVILEDKINQTLLLNNINKIYGDSVFELPLETEEGLLLVYQSSDDAIASINGNLVTIHKAGTVQITAEQAGTEIYAAFERTVDLVITKKAVTITVHDQTSVYGSPLVELDATIEGLVEGDEFDPKLEKEEGLTVRSYEITSNASDLNYQITVIKGTYTITKKAITILASISKIYDGNNNVINPLEMLGIENDDEVMVAGYYEDMSAGEVKNVNFVLSGDDANNYLVTGTYQGVIQKKHIDIQYVGESSLVYTGTNFVDILKPRFDGIIAGEEPLILKYVNKQTGNEYSANEVINAGEYQLTITLVSDNYDLEDEVLNADILISQKEYIITSDIIDSYTYNGEEVDFKIYANDESLLQSLGVIEIYLGDEQVVQALNAGVYRVLIRPVDQHNNSFIDNEIEFVINQKVVEVAFVGIEYTYNGKVQKPTASISNKVIGDELELVLSYKLQGSEVESDSIDAGSYDLVVLGLSGSDKGNYTLSEVAHQYIIKKQTITVNYGVLPSIYNYQNQYPSLQFSVSSEIVQYHIEDTLGNIVDEVINVGTYKIVINILNDNYFVQVNTREFRIEKLMVQGSVKLSSNSLMYNGNPQNNVVSHMVENETEYILKYLKDEVYYDDIPSMAGEYTVVLVPTDDNIIINQNYPVYEVRPLPVIVTYLNPEVTYNGQVQGINYVIENLIGDDQVELTFSYNDLLMARNAGVYQVKIVSINNENYTSTTASNTNFKINKISLQIKANEMRINWDQNEVAPTYQLLIDGVEASLPATDSIEVVLYRENPDEKIANKNYAILLDSYLIEDGNNGDNYDVEYTPENYIFEGTIVGISLQNEFTYTGNPIEIVLDSGDAPNTIFDIKYYQNDLEITAAELVNAGEYHILVSIKEEYLNQYSLTDAREFLEESFVIAKKDISDTIVVNQASLVYTGGNLSIDLNLTGYEALEIAYTLVDSNNEIVELLNAGTYQIKVIIIDDNYEGESEIFDFVIEKAQNNQLPIVGLDSLEITHSGISINDINDFDYSLDGINWQTGNVFSDLTDNQDYTVYIRYSENPNYQASDPILLEVKTLNYLEFIAKVNELSEHDPLSNYNLIKEAEVLRSEIDEDYQNLSAEVKTALEVLDNAKASYNQFLDALEEDVVDARKVASNISYTIVSSLLALTLALTPLATILFRKLSLFNRGKI